MILGGFMVPHPPLIIPEVGRGEEKKISRTIASYETVGRMVSALAPETIVVISPHSVMYSDYFHISPGTKAEGDFGQFRAGQVRIAAEYDEAFRDELLSRLVRDGFPAGTDGERDARLDHATMIPLYFIGRYLSPLPKIIRIGLSGLPLPLHYALGRYLQQTADALNRRTVIIGSGDLSHCLKAEGPYGFQKEGPVYDQRIMKDMGEAAFDRLLDYNDNFLNDAQECGHRSFVIMAGALDGLAVNTQCLSHEDTFGVGYGICTYEVTGRDPDRCFLDSWLKRQQEENQLRRAGEDAYIALARQSVETYVRTGRTMRMPEGLPREMTERAAGVFVSLHRYGNLRGCIGTISAVRSCIAEEIIANAVSACAHDPRFSPVTTAELADLVISVDVLGPTEPIHGPEDLDVRRYGVIVSKGRRRGLLLPNLEGVDTVQRQIEIAAQKAGLSGDEDGLSLERFEVVRHEVKE